MSHGIIDIRHPDHDLSCADWHKFRLTYDSDCRFRDRYLKTFSVREDREDFANRKSMTYIPAFAKTSIKEIENAITQRIPSVTRKGGSPNYQDTVVGKLGGVDLHDRSMNQFIINDVLPDLLSIGKIGIYVDNASLIGESLADAEGKHPYLYTYPAENILSWKHTPTQNGSELVALLLKDTKIIEDEEFGLPIKLTERFRFLKLIVNSETGKRQVEVTFFNARGDKEEFLILDIPHIPFVVTKLKHSLLTNTADMQIALMNLCSSDLSYLLKSNYPFYTEQYNPLAEQNNLLSPPNLDLDGTAKSAEGPTPSEISVGTTQGRRYPKDTERPGFISPPIEPVKISMEKQEQLKREIRTLTFLSVADLNPVSASAESKKQNILNLEAGLSAIGMELQHMEQQISKIFANYESIISPKVATVIYPAQYSLMSESERHIEAENKRKLLGTIPSLTFGKAVSKQIADITIGNLVSTETLENIHTEIDKADAIIADPQLLVDLKRESFMDTPLASRLAGLPEGSGEKAIQESIDKAKRIVEAQTKAAFDIKNAGARGVPEIDINPDSSLDEKSFAKIKNKRTRGKGRPKNA